MQFGIPFYYGYLGSRQHSYASKRCVMKMLQDQVGAGLRRGVHDPPEGELEELQALRL